MQVYLHVFFSFVPHLSLSLSLVMILMILMILAILALCHARRQHVEQSTGLRDLRRFAGILVRLFLVRSTLVSISVYFLVFGRVSYHGDCVPEINNRGQNADVTGKTLIFYHSEVLDRFSPARCLSAGESSLSGTRLLKCKIVSVTHHIFRSRQEAFRVLFLF